MDVRGVVAVRTRKDERVHAEWESWGQSGRCRNLPLECGRKQSKALILERHSAAATGVHRAT